MAATAQVPPKTFKPVLDVDWITKAHRTTKMQSSVAMVMKSIWKPLMDIFLGEKCEVIRVYLPKKPLNSMGSEKAKPVIAIRQKANTKPRAKTQYTNFFS